MYVCVCVSTFSNISSETTGQIEAKFHMKPPWDGGTKFYSNCPGNITKTAVMPIYGKNLKNLLLRNQKAYDIETSYVASGSRVLRSCSNDDPGMTLTYFTGRSILVLNG